MGPINCAPNPCRQSISVPDLFHSSVHLFQTSVPCSCSRQSTCISVPDLFHASVPDFRSMQLFQTKYFRSRSVPCICSRLPFLAAVTDKVFPFQICSMHLLQTSVPCSSSRQSISVPDLLHAFVPLCVPFPIPFHYVFHSIFHSIQCSVLCSSNRHQDKC